MRRAVVFVLVVLVLQVASRAEKLTDKYLFISGQSTLRQTGGFAGIDELFTIEGYFRVTVDYDANTAQFDYVNSIASNDSNWGPHDVNEVFQMTQLVSTDVNEFLIRFEDTNPPIGGIEINLLMTFQGNQVHLTGTRQWPSVMDSFQYDIDAVAQDAENYIYVDDDGPADFDNIQAAINDSNDGDVIIVADGTYTGAGNKNLDFGGRAITVRSENGPEATIIDCENSGRGFYFHSGEGPNSIVSGLTITGGMIFCGGGIYCRDSSPTIHNNIITGNFASWDGVEIPGFGGGIDCYNSSAVITDNVIIYNSVEGRGGGIFASGSSLILSNNLIAENHAFAIWGFFPGPGDGGGISCTTSSLVMTNNTISSNCAHDLLFPFVGHGKGGGIYCSSSTLILVNNILWSDSPDEINEYDSNVTVSYCDIEGGWAGEGNIDVNPLFADPCNDDYHLQSQAGRWDANSQSWVTDANTSECIDAGDWMTPVGFEPFPNGGRINMGAYGGTVEASKSYFGTEPCETIIAGDINGDCKVDFVDLAIMALHWQQEQ